MKHILHIICLALCLTAMAAYGTEGKRPSATAQKMEQAGYVNIQKPTPRYTYR